MVAVAVVVVAAVWTAHERNATSASGSSAASDSRQAGAKAGVVSGPTAAPPVAALQPPLVPAA